MAGDSGVDRMNGGVGDSRMLGGTNIDFFGINIFLANCVEVITDFQVNIDRSRLYNISFASFNSVWAAITQDGVDTVIDLDAADTVHLQNVGVNSLDAGTSLFSYCSDYLMHRLRTSDDPGADLFSL